jgi:hypothetical protein
MYENPERRRAVADESEVTFWQRQAQSCEISSSHGGEYEAQRLIALMMEAAGTSETSADIQLRTRQYIPEDSELLRTELFTHIVSTFCILRWHWCSLITDKIHFLSRRPFLFRSFNRKSAELANESLFTKNLETLRTELLTELSSVLHVRTQCCADISLYVIATFPCVLLQIYFKYKL